MSAFVRLYRLLNLLSIDVVGGALICAVFFADILHVSTRSYGLLALGLTVWIIYTADHLRDAREISGRASTERHRFHQVHQKELIVLLGLAILIDGVTIFFIKQQVLEWGIVLSLVVFAYLFVQGWLKFLKELFIAVLYTCGILLLSVPVSNITLNTFHYLLVLQFGLIALTNLLMFSWFDRDLDQQEGQNSFVTLAGEKTTRLVIWSLLTTQLLLTAIQGLIGMLLIPSLILGVMGLVLFIIFFFRSTLAWNDRYRLLGDAVFFLPIIYLF
jgi:hypothetical protein